MDRPITPFYCCYLLRSTTAKLKRGPSLYVGSTPNPRRRLKQHNGETKGGAQKTKRDNRRPWEMTIVVAGFPSKIAALQFEWAWQHPQVTRHISSAEWNSEVVTNDEQSTKKAGKRKKPPSRPRTGLVAKLLDLQLLLRARSFARWPLNVTFFSRDVYAIWNGKDVRPYRRLPDDFQATLESSIPTTGREPSPITQDMEMAERMVRFDRRTTTAALYSLSVDYSGIKAQLERSLFLLDGTRSVSCAICTGDLVHQAALTVLCSNADCNAPFHLHCLATRFLDQDCVVGELLPQNGQCPCCGSSMHWSDLVKELSLRSRGQAEVLKLLKSSKRNKAHATSEVVAERSELMQDPDGNDRFADEEDDDDEDAKDDEVEYDAGFAEAHPTQSRSHGASAMPNDLDSDGDLPLPSIERRPKERSRQVNKDRLQVPVVADSEWDDVEEIT